MNLPSVNCKIEILCSINPSEDPEKVILAISNIFSSFDSKIENFSFRGNSNSLKALEKIQENINSMKAQKIYRKILEKNLTYNSTWFYLNKQAAFVNKVAICEESDESPLGPIKIILSSPNIDRIITWLTFKEESN